MASNLLRHLAPAVALVAAVGCSRQLPEALVPELEHTPPGKLLLVEFIDFECPFCRENHAALQAALAPHRARVHLVRKQVPLEKHPMSRPAARAAVCADKLGKGDEVADALAHAALEDIGPEGVTQLGVAKGLDKSLFEACVHNPATDAHIDADGALFEALGGGGVPRLWIGDRELRGLQTEETLGAALAAALR